MRVLRIGHRGEDVERWQLFLVGQGLSLGEADGVFGARTAVATKTFQTAQGLSADGVVGPGTLGKALLLGFDAGIDDDASPDDESGAGWPPRPAFPPLVTTAARQQLLGRFDFAPAPTPNNPEGIKILGDWVSQNIVNVTIPQLKGIQGAPGSGTVQVHRLVRDQLAALWQAWEAAGLLPLVRSWAGSWVPRFVRGSRSSLSNHAFGSAFDINAAWNGLGLVPPLVGATGSVRKLVPLANAHGFFWGGHFQRPDGMHFEAALLLPSGAELPTSSPPKSGAATGGRALVQATEPLSVIDREKAWLDHLRAGRFPDFLRGSKTIELSALIDGAVVDVEVDVLPDYVAIGTDADFVRVPFSRPGAEEAAGIMGGVLPTTKLVDAIHAQSDVKLAPAPKTPGPKMMSLPYILEHHDAIEAARQGRQGLVAGHKKDVVLTNRLRAQPNQVPIYGWHRLNGVPIQPLSLLHELTYADYSHGVRVIGSTVRVQGQTIPTRQVLADPGRAALLSGEGPMVVT